VVERGDLNGVRLVAGLDAALSADGLSCLGVVVLWDRETGQAIEQCVARRPLLIPYIPGLLSFREAPALIAALARLRRQPHLLMCDGQGRAHPRRFGLACHLGVLTDLPAIGCAKSLLVGKHAGLAQARGSRAPLMHRDELIGQVLRTRAGVRPVVVSVGHRVALDEATALVLSCATRYRLPEPTRLADALSKLVRARERADRPAQPEVRRPTQPRNR
jgi:deoxyribonuclease V